MIFHAARTRRWAAVVLATIMALMLTTSDVSLAASDAETAGQRRQMVNEVAAMALSTSRVTGRPQFSDPVMNAMQKVERHRFVPLHLQRMAYLNQPLPIGEGQTISQPYIVALSTALIDPQPSHVVLEIGTGSGYQAAVLAEIVKQVYSIEIVEPLGRTADVRLRDLGYRNVEVRIGDGYAGWPEKAPFDAIVVTAAAPTIPQPLVEQLKPGGKMVIPVGSTNGGQELLLLVKNGDGTTTKTVVLPVRFVPLTGKGGAQHAR